MSRNWRMTFRLETRPTPPEVLWLPDIQTAWWSPTLPNARSSPTTVPVKPRNFFSKLIPRRLVVAHRHARMRMFGLPAVWRGMLWVALSGLVLSGLNATVRTITLSLDPFLSQFLRYLFGTVAMLPLVWRQGWQKSRPSALPDRSSSCLEPPGSWARRCAGTAGSQQ